jgi:hypothetical protein
MTDLMLSFTNAEAGRHAGSVEGVLGARHFEAADDLSSALQHPYRFLTGYDVSSGELAAVAQRLTNIPFATADVNGGESLRWWFEELSPRVTTDGAGGPFDHMIVLTNPRKGSEDEFNRWYDEVHIPDVLNKIGGYVGAHRFRRAEMRFDQNCPWKYLAIYDVPDGMITHSFERLQWSRSERKDAVAAGREPQVPIAPVMAEPRLAWFYRQREPAQFSSA